MGSKGKAPGGGLGDKVPHAEADNVLSLVLLICNLDKSSLQSLDFTVNRFFMKLFKTSNIEIVQYCQNMSGLQLPSVLLGSRYQKFLSDVPCDVYS